MAVTLTDSELASGMMLVGATSGVLDTPPEPILGRIGRSRRRQREADLQALLKLTVLAVTAVDSQLKLPAGDHESAVGFSGEVVEKLRAVLETATKSQQDEQIKLM